MTLIKTSILNAFAVGIKTLTAILLNKILAVYVGPVGYAAIGQFQNFVTMLTAFASGALNTGVTKYTAEYFDDQPRQRAIWRTAGTIAIVGSLSTGLALVLLREQLSEWFLNDPGYTGVFTWFGVTLVMFTFNGLLLAILNGKKEVSRLVAVNIIASFVGLAVTGGLAVVYGLYGALVAMAINQSIVLFVSLAICYKLEWFRASNLFGRIDPQALSGLGKFSLMALVSAACVPVAQILIRNHLGDGYGAVSAGNWEAMIRVSDMYLRLVTIPLGIYYLPRLAEIRDRAELRWEIINGYRIILPVVVVGALTIYSFRDWLVLTLFTEEFRPMIELFAWQMAGDVVKIGSWLLAYLMLGRAMVKLFIVSEIAFSASWVALVYVFTDIYGVQGAQIGYFVNYALYWFVMWFVMRRAVL